MGENRQNSNQGTKTQDHQSLAENIGISGQDFGGGRGQTAGAQESVSSQDQFSEDVMQILDENDYEGEIEPQPPTDYFDEEGKS
jgi:hypothetical protein